MSPRSYESPTRRVATEATRLRILEATGRLLRDEASPRPFSVESVAREAGVVRATVYYQFGSRAGLIEAYFDHMASSAKLAFGIGAAMSAPRGLDAVAMLIDAFHELWESDQLVMKRVRAMGVLDAELGEVLASRNNRRRGLAAGILDRVVDEGGTLALSREEAIDLLWTLSDFEIFNALRAGRSRDDVTRMLTAVALRSLLAA